MSKDMTRIAVFDSGFGSLSIINAIQKVTCTEIIYFADQKRFPYGKKSKSELRKIILTTIKGLKQNFLPDLIVIGSNTPSIMLGDLFENDDTLIGVHPPLTAAEQKTKTNSIAILSTTAALKSKALDNYIKKNICKNIFVTKIDATELINLVESGKFLSHKSYCSNKINLHLKKILSQKNIDVVTLSSTHLPFLLPILEKNFPNVQFLDPAVSIAKQIVKHKKFHSSTRNTIRIFCSGNPVKFQKQLKKLKIKNKIKHLEFT